MRSLIAFIVELLPLDASGRRAMDETLADWKHEATAAATPLHRTRAGAHGVVAVCGVLGRVVIADLGRPATYGVCAGVLALAVGFSLVMIQLMVLPSVVRPIPAELVVPLLISLLPMALTACVPLALLTPPFAQRPGGSMGALCLLIGLLSIGNLGWLTPHSNQWFREAVVAHNNPPTPGFQPPDTLPRGHAELTVPELVRLAQQSGYGDRLRAVQTLSTRAVLLVMIPVSLIVGAQARRFTRARGQRYGGAVIAWGIVAIAWATATMGSGAIRTVLAAELLRTYHLQTYRLWLVPIACVAGAVVLALLARRRESRLTSSNLPAA